MILGPSGENIYPEEIESVLNGHAFVDDSLVQRGRYGQARRRSCYFNRDELEARYEALKYQTGR